MLAPCVPDPEPSTDLQRRYRVLDEAGRGASGVTYRALDTHRGEEVTLRIVPVQRADIPGWSRLADVDHPHVVRHHAAGLDEGRPYVVTEALRGVSLAQLLERHARLDVATAVRLACQICDGLDAAHRQGVVHRDVKPANVRVIDGTAKLVDFALAEALGERAGTPAYMAPESAQGQPADERSDVYAVGVLLYELLAGHVPFVAEDASEVLSLQILEPPPRLGALRPDLPPLVEQVVMRALSKRPVDRPRSAAAFAAELRGAHEMHHDSRRTPFSLPSHHPADAKPGLVLMALTLGAIAAAFTIALVLALVVVTGAVR
jgi:serine/threonine protein kinase